MKILLHTCCGPCSVMPVELLKAAGHELTAYFYNPNIHPYREYKKRRNTMREYLTDKIPVIIDDDYALEDFIRQTADRINNRCAVCYQMRLERTAKFAAEQGYEMFSSTLLVSPYQNHQLIKDCALEAAKKYGVEFYYQDFRPYFQTGQEKARAAELYLQGYCGCIYSEKDRYWSQPKTPIKFYPKKK